jgi:hypothetical protein
MPKTMLVVNTHIFLIRGVGFEISVPQHNIWQKTLKMRVVEHA